MNISSRQLKAFVLTARHQSFSRAAEQLFITQSGMSVLVRELEGQLGFRLFDRTTRKVALTEFGTKFLPIADRSLLELEAAASLIGRAASVANRRIAIGATPLIASKLLPSVISDYAAHSPGMKIVLHDGDRSRVVAMALSGQIDVGVGCFLQPVSGVRRLCRHSDFRDPGLPPAPHREAPAYRSHGADRSLPDHEPRQETASGLRGLRRVPQELHRGMGRALVAQVRLSALRG